MADGPFDKMASGPLSEPGRIAPAPLNRRHRRRALWAVAPVVFAVGAYVGWNINANAGGLLWLASAVLAFIPFLSHADA